MEKIIKVPEMDSYRLIAISDIHGHLDRFERLLNKVELKKDDYMVIIGDFINRGPESYKTIKRIAELKMRPRTYILKGNHEAFIYNCLSKDSIVDRFLNYNKEMYFKNIVHELLERDNIDINDIATGQELRHIIMSRYSEMINFLNELPIILEFDKFLFVHGGYDNTFNIKDEEIRYLKYDDYNTLGKVNEDTVIVGHWPTSNIYRDKECNVPFINEEKNIISIDGGTGIKGTGELNAFIIDKVDGESPTYHYIQENDFYEKSIVSSYDFDHEDRVYVSYPNLSFDIIERGEKTSKCRHTATGKLFTIYNCLLNEEEKLSVNYINNFLNLDVGTIVEVCKVYKDCILVKYNGEFGWLDITQLDITQ